MALEALKVGPVIPVSDIAVSRSFYEERLGLRGEPAPGGYALYAGAGTRLFLLEGTQYAGRAEWPLASFQTDDLAATVEGLRHNGVDLLIMGEGDPFQTDERGIADLGDVLIAWFRDPDNQVISVFQLTQGERSHACGSRAVRAR
jgi:catechol 2,3-dioxygenase-like lactoylglutathione lyase family enzyme